MAMTGGTVRSSVSLRVRTTYPHQGIGTSLKDLNVEQFANAACDTLEFGTDDGQFDTVTVSDRAIPAGSSVTYDLYTGTDLKDVAGFDAPFRLVRFAYVSIVSGGDSSGVRVGGAASDEWVGFFVAAGDKQDIYPGGPPFYHGDLRGNAKSVTSTTKNLKIENLGAASVTVRVVVAGNVVVGGMLMGLLGLTYP